MRIAQLAPLFESVPPQLYGGTERVVSYLTEKLVEKGHEVTLFASRDCRTAARLVPACDQALRLDATCRDPIAPHIYELECLLKESERFDLIHSHVGYLGFPAFRHLRLPTVTTQHGRLDLPELGPVMREFSDLPQISISNAQRRPLPGLAWLATVYHGLPKDLLPFHPKPGSYLAFLGRLSREKRVDRAIEIARRTGLKLRIAAKVDPADQVYFKTVVEPMLAHPWVEYIGEISESQKSDFLGNALALIFPIDWPEPFGIVLIEAMACGTPIVAYQAGSVPEIIEPGVTGFLVDNLDAAVQAVHRCPDLDRRRIRRRFDERFTSDRMAEDYLAAYRRLLEGPDPREPLGAQALEPGP